MTAREWADDAGPVVEPWGYGWFEHGGKKRASGYLPTVDYPDDDRVSEGPFPLYRALTAYPAAEAERDALAAEVEALRGLLQEGRWYVNDSLEAHEHSDGRDLLRRIDGAFHEAGRKVE